MLRAQSSRTRAGGALRLRPGMDGGFNSEGTLRLVPPDGNVSRTALVVQHTLARGGLHVELARPLRLRGGAALDAAAAAVRTTGRLALGAAVVSGLATAPALLLSG